MSRINKDSLIFLGVYLVALGIMLHYNLTHPIINDGVYEYKDYLSNIQEGWVYRNSSVNSGLIPLWVPAMLQRVTNWDPWVLFRVFPPFWYALMPAFVWLTTRRYFTWTDSLIATLVVIFSSYIFFFPDVGRVGIALGFMSGMIWALLAHRILLSGLFSILVVFSHYGTAIIVIGLVLAVLVTRLAWNRVSHRKFYPPVRLYLTTLVILVAVTWVWHFGYSHYSGDSMFSTLFRPEEARAIHGEDYGRFSLLDITSRDDVTQRAFGVGFWKESIPAKIEILSNWIVVGFLSLGFVLMLRGRKVSSEFKVMALALYGLVLITIAVPELSNYYGTQRVYFTSLIILAGGVPIGINWLSSKLRVNYLVLPTVVLALYAMSTSGFIYTWFGLAKTIPVIVIVP